MDCDDDVEGRGAVCCRWSAGSGWREVPARDVEGVDEDAAEEDEGMADPPPELEPADLRD